jgi:hypothetical protein
MPIVYWYGSGVCGYWPYTGPECTTTSATSWIGYGGAAPLSRPQERDKSDRDPVAGVDSMARKTKCFVCDGRGEVWPEEPVYGVFTCDFCNGAGWVQNAECG